MSLDGYIADNNGGVAWLNGHGNDNENMDSYSEFVKDIDTILMGWNTYHQIVTERIWKGRAQINFTNSKIHMKNASILKKFL